MHVKPHSESTKKKISLSLKGRKAKPFTESHRKNLSISMKGKKGSRGHLGKKHTEESKKKISDNRKGKCKGEKNPSWKGGVTPLAMSIRNHAYYHMWVVNVFKRDHYVCQDCGQIGGDLEAHHLHKFSDILKECNIKSLEDAAQCDKLWDSENGQTLCIECHNKTK